MNVRRMMIIAIGLMSGMGIWLMCLFPQESLDAAINGLVIWWDVLFPALFPFFVISEVLLGFGIVHFLGTLLDPLMRPLFRVPGIGGFVMAMGLVSGYPVGARLTSQLWEQKLISRAEGERLVAFTTTADPIFLIGAVAVGFFHNVGLAVILAVSHYGSSFIVGFIMRYYGQGEDGLKYDLDVDKQEEHCKPIVSRALWAMHRARLADARPLGLLVKQAIEVSLKLVFVIGGLVVFFAVMIELLTLSHMIIIFLAPVQWMLPLLGLPERLADAIVNGLFEVTLGVKYAGEQMMSHMLIHQVAVASFLLSWGGFSVHAQIVSLLSHTGMRYPSFLMARLLHGLLALALVYMLWDVMLPVNSKVETWLASLY